MNQLIKGNNDEPVFDLALENQLLILKLKAEFGAECSTGNQEIPPIVVNEFLRSVYDFEKKFREPRKEIRIYEKIGQPFFKREEELSDKQLSRELKRFLKLFRQHQLELDIYGDYEERVLYKFITEEFFHHEMEDVQMPGYIHHFCYEDFHPDHESDIRQRAVEFLSKWFSKQLSEYTWELADPIIHPDTREFPRNIVLEKIRKVFDSYRSFANCEYMISDLQFYWDEQNEKGRAVIEGKVRYDATLESGEILHLQGPFEFYLSNNTNWWSIFYFVFPGFNW